MLLKMELIASSFEEMKSKIAAAFAEVQKDDGLKDLGSFQPTLAIVGGSNHTPEAFDGAAGSTVPPMNTALLAPTTTSNEKDNRGIPHDTRIHSMEGSKNKDGSWRNKRGVEKAELKGAAPAVIPTVLPPAPLPPPPAVAETVPPAFTAPAIVQAPVVQAAPVVAPAPIPQLPGQKPAHTLFTFKNNLMDILAQFITEQKINQAYVDSLVVHFAKTNSQMKNIWNIIGDEKQCMELFDVFIKAGWITRVEG